MPQSYILFGIPAFSLGLAAWVAKTYRPSRKTHLSALKHSVAGLFCAIVGMFALRLIFGENFPAFIPPEESSEAGFILGMAAGYGEAVLFRMLLCPLVYFASCRLLNRRIAIFAAIIATSICFAVLHEFGESGSVVDFGNFLTRLVIPGFLMGVLYFVVHPGFVIFLHSAAHIMIPILF